MIKYKQPLKLWVDDCKELLEAFESLCGKRETHLHSIFSEKRSAFAERNICSLTMSSTKTLKKNGLNLLLINWISLRTQLIHVLTGSLNLPQKNLKENCTKTRLRKYSNKYPSKTQVLYWRLS